MIPSIEAIPDELEAIPGELEAIPGELEAIPGELVVTLSLSLETYSRTGPTSW